MRKLHQFFLIECYLIRIWLKLQYPIQEKYKIIYDFRQFIHGQIAQGDTVQSKSDIYDLFGMPGNFAGRFHELRLEAEEKRYARESWAIRTFFSIVIVAMVLFFVFAMGIRILNRNNYIMGRDKTAESSSLLYEGEEVGQ